MIYIQYSISLTGTVVRVQQMYHSLFLHLCFPLQGRVLFSLRCVLNITLHCLICLQVTMTENESHTGQTYFTEHCNVVVVWQNKKPTKQNGTIYSHYPTNVRAKQTPPHIEVFPIEKDKLKKVIADDTIYSICCSRPLKQTNFSSRRHPA